MEYAKREIATEGGENIDKVTEAKEADAILQRDASTVQNWFEVHKQLLDGKLWEHLGVQFVQCVPRC